MKFIGRVSELSILNSEYEKDSSFVVVYGRRRVGKTALIKKFINNKDALYFSATNEVESFNMQRLLVNISNYTKRKNINLSEYKSWDKIFQLLINYDGKKRVLVIDEFQYLIKANAAFINIFKQILDDVLLPNKIMVIFCGSYISMMFHQPISYPTPLNQQKTTSINLEPLSFFEIKNSFHGISFKDLFEAYTVTGGIARYLEMFLNDKSVFKNINDNILCKNSQLYDEPLNLLEQEFREPMPLISALQAIANGYYEHSEISEILGESDAKTKAYLNSLVELNLVEKQSSDDSSSSDKQEFFYTKDNFIEFWFKFVNPYRSQLELDDTDYVLKRIKKGYIENHAKYIFEDVCKDYTKKICAQYGLNIKSVYSYWNNEEQIDILAIDNKRKTAIIGECMYCTGKATDKIYEQLKRKTQDIESLKSYNKIYIIYVVSGYVARYIEFRDNGKIEFTDM